MKNVLVFPCGSEIGLEIYRSIRYATHFHPIGGSSVDDHGQYVYSDYVGNLPMVDDEHFIDEINRLVQERQIDYILPAHDDAIVAFAEAKAAGKLACEVVTAPLETCRTARSKRATYAALKDTVPTPIVFESASTVAADDYPVFLKPDKGQGSKGTSLARNASTLQHVLEQDPSLLILEYLPGKEYTVDCFTDKNGALLFCEGRERVRISNGISVRSKTVSNEQFSTLAEQINQTLDFRGVWFFQLKERRDGTLVLMEVAPRVAGTMGLVRAKGVNLVLLSLYDAEGIAVSIFENKIDVTIDRALENSFRLELDYKHVYLDFDDLVILDGKVNPAVVAFVYQCHNTGRIVHLITKHAANIHETLEKYRLQNVFDEIITVERTAEKHRLITEKDAIFIDDSFAERKQVHEQCGIPTFDAHMIEALMEQL